MTWPRTLKDKYKYNKIIRTDDVAITIPLTPPHYKFFGIDSNGNGIYRRHNQDKRMNANQHKFVSIPYTALHRYEVMT
jgi:hypothetical protein